MTLITGGLLPKGQGGHYSEKKMRSTAQMDEAVHHTRQSNWALYETSSLEHAPKSEAWW